jgi:hypothetical protein
LLSASLLALWSTSALAAGDTWLITDGKGRGTVLITDAVGSLVVQASDNPFTKATGTITVGNFTDCSGPAHWHGTLFQKSDPKNGLECGWGHCQKIVPGPTLANDFVNMTKKVFSTADTIMTMQLQCNGPQTVQDMIDAVNLIISMMIRIDAAVGDTITVKQGEALQRLAFKVKSSLEKVKSLVEELVATPPDNLGELIKKSQKVKKDVEKALKNLKKFLSKLISTGLI